MSDGFLFGLTMVSAFGCALVGGVFFAFSSFVMKGLARLPAAQANAAMRAINIAAVTPLFMTALFGTGLMCLVLAGGALVTWQKPGSVYLLSGGLLYFFGSVVVTMLFNVPRNNALEKGSISWESFLGGWTAWNHVRTVTALVAAVLLAAGGFR